MKTRIEWRHGARVLKLDDTDHDGLPETDDVVELQEDGETHRFRVAGVESAVVDLEVVPDYVHVGEGEGAPEQIEKRRLEAESAHKKATAKAENLHAPANVTRRHTRKLTVTKKKK